MVCKLDWQYIVGMIDKYIAVTSHTEDLLGLHILIRIYQIQIGMVFHNAIGRQYDYGEE
jgi:hypothetical protein